MFRFKKKVSSLICLRMQMFRFQVFLFEVFIHMSHVISFLLIIWNEGTGLTSLAVWLCTPQLQNASFKQRQCRLVTEKMMHSLKVESYILFRDLTKDCILGNVFSDSSKEQFQIGKGGVRIYRSCCWRKQNIQSNIKGY